VFDLEIGLELGLAPGWREEFRSGEPTWPNADALEALARSSSSFCCLWLKRGVHLEGLAFDGEPNLIGVPLFGVPVPL
jgi:hypothetical protein